MTKYFDILKKAYADIVNNHTMSMAAGLSYYFVMSLFPLLILAWQQIQQRKGIAV